MNDEQQTALARRLASLTPQDFQSVLSAAKGQRVRTNQRPIPKKAESKFLTRFKALIKGKKLKIPFKLEGHFDVSIGLTMGDSVDTESVKVTLKPGLFSDYPGIRDQLQEAFWEADESDPKELKEYRELLATGHNLYNELYQKVQETCESYGQEFYEYWDGLRIKADFALDK